MTLTGHAAPSTFVLRGIIAHQGDELVSGHYLTMLAEGGAIWVVDDGECPRAHKEVPDYIQRGCGPPVLNPHTSIGSFEPPAKRPKTLAR